MTTSAKEESLSAEASESPMVEESAQNELATTIINDPTSAIPS